MIKQTADDSRRVYKSLPGLITCICLVPALVALALRQYDLAYACNTILLTILICVASLTDLTQRIIPNRLTYTTIGAAILLNLGASMCGMIDQGLIGFQSSILGLLLCFSLTWILFVTGGLGAGDVKMAAALGAILGPTIGVNALAWAYIAGASIVLAGGTASWMWTFAQSSLAARTVDVGLLQPGAVIRQKPVGLPMGFFFALGTILALNIGRLL